ncbi:hypothetical protein [Alkalibacillus haloalkaliphilus]|uniref:Uncharacterized protein n=1 Tax=Alkalibacillus haloalkaliphilus TaxID=94136 RepID=A0A511W7X2_9BACI|nr:hypothetical protein [Alkalibacillus haloalkaliphilus]GEN45492.1 hypothetical protein AHA02nite_12680 [Alkalibacillus haloalkaliphilus]
MDTAYIVPQGLALQGIPVIREDVPYIQHMLNTIYELQLAVDDHPGIHEEVPMVVVDPDVIIYD